MDDDDVRSLCVCVLSVHEAGEHKNPNAVNESRMIPMTHLCDPALDPSWKGSFDILGALDFAHRLLNNIIHAHPPSRVRRNVYEFSRLLPDTLKFELVSCGENWENPFNDIVRAKKILDWISLKD
ncbi:hypothetical protein CQW23_32289 [Capsicum baccatum]|uniref:AIPP2-like SPOC-like domain-containing protein n=1 Tax=Capsicum baccatum TaxID=33114 RepID=A0A2G2V542_CAPBA|nr:hypothetical protein CQW23_32289 [Capsicum baccatum]